MTSSKPSQPSLRRLYPGCRVQECFQWSVESLENLESSFNVQEYLQQLIRMDCSDVKRIVELPENLDDNVWQYEHLRQICLQLNLLVVALESECTKANCPEMKADGWLYLCAAHPCVQSCSAIDYIIHTLDGATILLNNSKYFPSRISVPEPSLKHFQSIARRLYRIFAHAYFHHREVYEVFERDTHLYARFLLLSRTYSLVPSTLVTIPDENDFPNEKDDNANDIVDDNFKNDGNNESHEENLEALNNSSAILLPDVE
ncbi:Mob1/phocein [Mycotypha africana]|uniref:Mob1/phocein n=1 Tax=Mycotypha africana TaxID=64632 RepID=UPI002300A2E9|nr:Mob1/phocein [Mycotypha africana]KAI8975727.1 Mob1/phocein [Mycotypha africana]